MRIVDARLTERGRTDGAIQGACCCVVFALQRISEEYLIGVARAPVDPLGAQQIVERRSGKGPLDCPRRQISYAHQRGAVLMPEP